MLVKQADALFVAQRFEEAAAAAKAALTLEPDSLDALRLTVRADVRLNQTDHALSLLDGLAGRQNAGTLDCQRILVLQNARRDAEARALLPACNTSPDLDVVTEAESRLRTDAESTAISARELGAENLSAAMRAVVLVNQHRYAEAEVLLREVLAENPDEALARVHHALCLYHLDRKAEAQKELQRLFTAGTWVRREDNGSVSGILTA